MYSPAQLKRGIERGLENPAFFAQELNRLVHRRGYTRPYNDDGVDVVAEDWDLLVILDACRYDMFEEAVDGRGRLEQRTSRGSHTTEFLRGNFGGRDLHDTVYVTASPQLHKWGEKVDASFHAVENVWAERWDDEYGTVLPETMVGAVEDAAERYPRKRLVAHFIQPHYPFIGWGRHLNTDGGLDIWNRLRRGDVDHDPLEVRAALQDNLALALERVWDLVDDVRGKAVVTSDHGNMLGERSRPVPIREWGHPPGNYTEELVTVPWLVLESEERRPVVEDPPVDAEEASADTVQRLADLGYVDA